MAIFSKFFGDVMSHIIRSNADKIINTISELFIKQNIVFNFVYFSSAQTLIIQKGVFLKKKNWPSLTCSYSLNVKTFKSFLCKL